MKKLLLALALLWTAPAFGQQCPTRPPGDNTNACASTAFVVANSASQALTQNFIIVGSAGNIAVGVPMSNDCSIVSSGAITCTKTNGVAFATLATKASPVCADLTNAAASCSTNTTNATNITSGTLPAAQLPAFGSADVSCAAAGGACTIAANAVTNAKLATMAAWTIKGNVTSGSAVPTDFTIDGLTLKATPAASDEVILWDVAGAAIKKATVSTIGGGAITLLNTITASNSASISDTTSLTSTYTNYEIVCQNLIPAIDNVSMELRLQSGGTFQTTTYVSTVVGTSGGSAGGPNTATGFIPLANVTTGTGSQTNVAPGLSATIYITAPSNTSQRKNVWGNSGGNSVTGTTGATVWNFSGYWDGGNGAITGVQFLPSSGNLTSGNCKIYGIN